MIPAEELSVAASSFLLIGLAEMGDKSQLVCMTLAARHRHWPVLAGASAAFLVLNTLAVTFGAAVALWIPEQVTAGVVAVLFAAFGIHALRNGGEDDCEDAAEQPGHGIFLTAFLFIFLAEFGDKTQIAVAGLAVNFAPVSVWIGASAALVLVSAIGVIAGQTVLRRLPRRWLHRASGALFLVFAAIAGWQALTAG